VPAELLGLLCEDRAVPVLDKPGPYYLLDTADLPDGPALVALARDRYRLALTRAATAAQALMAGAEAVLFTRGTRSSTASTLSRRSVTTWAA
jgi:hypothetical protein